MKLFRLFGLPTRLVVFQRVARHPQTATQLAKEMSISRSAIVQHLTVLETAGLVSVASAGRNRIYSADRAGLAPLADWLARYGTNSFTDIHSALFPDGPPAPRTLEAQREGVREHLRKKHVRRPGIP